VFSSSISGIRKYLPSVKAILVICSISFVPRLYSVLFSCLLSTSVFFPSCRTVHLVVTGVRTESCYLYAELRCRWWAQYKSTNSMFNTIAISSNRLESALPCYLTNLSAYGVNMTASVV
jgi:hypothetical protein